MRKRALIRGLLLAAVVASLGAGAGAQIDDDRDARPFALPMARDARTLAERARDHLRAQRWAEGIAALERLIDEHRGDVLPDDWRESASQYTNYPAHPGAAAWAHEMLAQLPREARSVYRERYGARASAALSGAGKERRALVEVAQRYPFTLAAAEAWTALGDLEVESGHVDEAVIVWERARAVHAWNGGTEPSGLGARLALARSLGGPEGAAAAAEPGPVPRNDADSWPQAVKLDFEPFQRTGVRQYAYNLSPLLTQDRVLVGTTHRLYAIDAFSGERLWEVGPPEGWPRLQRPDQNELFQAIGYEQISVTPGVGGNIAVTALQIPFSETPNDSWQGIEILAAIPERRLYAYDLETGKELWNHAPPLAWRRGRWEWDGYTGSFSQRMMVAASPVVVGSRVLVPCYRMQGRIEYHVACYDLSTGQTLWTTALVSGQRETNMFGRVDEEFAASPLCVSGDRVIAQTELGTVACLDLVTGDIVWESLYKQIPLPKTASYSTPDRQAAWRVARPLVADGLVISTPSDSKLLLGIDLRDGRVLWSPSRDELSDLDGRTRSLKYNLLFGADEDTVYLAGEKIGALQRPGGLRGRSGFIERWTHALDEDRNSSSPLPRPALGRNEVVVPTLPDRLVLDRRTGDVLGQKTAAWTPVEAGNVAIGNGMLFSLGRECLTGYFDWEILLERQRERRAENPDDVLVAIDTAELLTRRAHTVHETGEDAVALAHLREAQLLLEPLQATQDTSSRRRVTKSLHEVLRTQALVRAQTDINGALEALEAARALAPTTFALRDTLLDEERLLRDRARQRRIEILDELARSCGDLPLPPHAFDGDLRWLVGESLIDPDALAGTRDSGLSVGLWALLSRADARARAQDTPGALEDLHLALERYGDFELVSGITVATLAGDRIGRRIELDGPAEYATFEARARALYDEALAAGDRSLLERIGRLYPHSRAAREALRDRLDLAYRDDRTETVAEIAYAALSLSPEIDPQEVPTLLRLASALGRSGNTAFERGSIAWIARVLPDARSDLPEHGGRLLREIAAELEAQAVKSDPPTPRFDHRASFRVDLPGRFELVGTLPPLSTSAETAPVTTHVYLNDGDTLQAFSSDEPGRPAWSAEHLELDTDPERCALSETRIIAAARDRLIALDREGLAVWTRDLGPEREVQSLRSAQGICFAVVGGAGGQAETVLALDAHGGIPLWDLPLPQRDGRWDWEPPISSGGVAVLLARAWGQRSHALVVDAFRGRVISDVVLERGVARDLDKAAWIEGDLLVVPDFASSSAGVSGISAYHLRSGKRAWEAEFPPGEELHSLASHGGKTYMITQIAQIESQARNGGIYALDTATGGVRTVVPLSAGDEAIGLEQYQRTALETPYLFLRSRRANGRGTPISAVHLPFEKRWVYTLPVDSDEIYDRPMPMPAVSADCVVLAYFTAGKNRVNWQAQLEFIDKNAGTHIENRNLANDLAKAERLELRGLGSALFLVAKGRQSDRMQIWEDVR